MRLTSEAVARIRETVAAVAGPSARIVLFGSRADDAARGGDVDLLVELPEAVAHPARLSAELSVRLTRVLDGRDVDVVLAAPNLRDLPIHQLARKEGVAL